MALAMHAVALFVLAASSTSIAADAGYTLGVPKAPKIRNTATPGANAWLSANANFSAMSVAVAKNAVSVANVAGAPAVQLASQEAGFAIERTKPEYYLGDVIDPPDDVDWTATYAWFQTNSPAGILFDPTDRHVFVTEGGTLAFSWILSDGTTNDMTYVTSASCSGRPRRIYWTDEPYNGPCVDLSGKFVKLFGSSELITPQYGTTTNISAGISQEVSNSIVSGLVIDTSTHMLYAHGQLQGQVVMAYYDTGLYEHILHVQTVEVCKPVVNRLAGEIGVALKADGRGYPTDGLLARPTAVDTTDNRGDYYYQHEGQHSYSPKHGNVYPLRPTTECPWNMEVYWMETDEMEVQWPFELDQYVCDWPKDATVFVRGEGDAPGRSIYVPSDYTGTLMDYQEPEGHARAVETDGTFTTSGEGYSLLKLTGNDNVWFVPVHSVLRTNSAYFTLESEDIRVGRELVLRGGNVAGKAGEFSPTCDPDSPGYIYEAASDPVWNPNIYSPPTADVQTGGISTNIANEASSGSSDTNSYDSVVYGVRPGTLEVWWNTSVLQEDMPTALTIPTLPQVYGVRWPVAGETPEIVIASQLGSASESAYSHNLAIYFSEPEATAELPRRVYFDSELGGTVMFWAKADEAGATFTVSGIGSFTVSTNWQHYSFTDISTTELAPTLSGLGVSAGEILFWNKTLTAEEIEKERWKVHSGKENHLTGCFTFIEGTDLSVNGTDTRYFYEKVLGTRCAANHCLADENGPLARDTGVIKADSDTTPVVYAQNDASETGYNPNEEHAIVQAGSGGYVAWALRCDLNTAESSAPGVLVEYVKDRRKAMQWFDVVVTNAVYPELAADCTAGSAFPGPHPIDFFDDPWCAEDTWDENVTTAPAFRDRKGQLWARAAGTATMRMFYRMQDGFAFPQLDAGEWPAVGDAVPWLSLLGGNNAANPLEGTPAAWTWRVSWPAAVAEMAIGRTLTTASDGLPEVWNAKSAGIVWPATDAERDATALLFDPTVAQSAGFPESTYATVSAAIDDLGIKQGSGGNATLRKGKWTFDGLPPAISSRFYLDTTANVTNCLKLVGEKEDNSGGVELLHVNVLSDSERGALETLLDETASTKGKAAWRAAIAKLATKAVRPSPHTQVSGVEDRIDYIPRDHYALFSMGSTNYVTIIENDATNALMAVNEGDPISMHVIKVVPEYYTGRVVTREDPLNLLSQQLSVIYAEAFAGEPEQYVFEWRKCRPHADGSVPTDFDNEYTQKFAPTNGLTRFTIGHQGDTLANMVNTYYAVRYRAASESSPAYAAMGYAWSEWTDPPALAEGWVQRVLNRVTPFAQRMRDFEENEAETAVSMIRQAGAPYEGDVALNQDNLKEVGLIQLYETLLSKAESMSLAVGIDDADANKQLQLAVARLADLYNTLGDEAYTDALNPTIGFGSNFNNKDVTAGFELDYGALSSSLFAFDNQVPTLLDEELALLRGRTGENAPSTHLSPYYNRLVWNFTRGITAGEVAYAVNYDITGSNTGLIDYQQAAEMFPQGHGDAYGHYLSALSGYYRLLRNPYFSWGEPAMGEMVVADSVLNVDYYDEAQFAKAACNVAKVAVEVVDRTARKAYRDNNGATGAGYLDDDTTRNFGYGEWASRGGWGALANWAVANAILGEAPDSSKYYRLLFGGEDDSVWTVINEDDAPEIATDNSWTIEFQLVPDADQTADPAVPVALASEDGVILFTRGADGALSLVLNKVDSTNETYTATYWHYTNTVDAVTDWETAQYFQIAVTNAAEKAIVEVGFAANPGTDFPETFPDGWEFTTNTPPTFAGWEAMLTYEREVVDETNGETNTVSLSTFTQRDVEVVTWFTNSVNKTFAIGTAEADTVTLVALRSDNGNITAVTFDASGAKTSETDLDLSSLATPSSSLSFSPYYFSVGNDYVGEIGEFRVWRNVARTDSELLAKRSYVSPLADGLALYLRTISDTAAGDELADERDSAIVWYVDGGSWIEESQSGMNIAFDDEGLKRIDRSTVVELSTLAGYVPTIQKKIDQMDAGLNPLGLSSAAIPFDITPVGASDGTATHFEQIRERAGTALSNARKSLDKAQTYGSRLRLLQEAQESEENMLETMELETKNKLIEYFGYPYEGDIGPSGTYPQGYDGPDIYNYAWMDLDLYGLTDVEDTVVVTRTTKQKPQLLNLFVPFWPSSKTTATDTWTFEKSATGVVVKPSTVTGRRRAQGKIQDALGEFLIKYANLKSKISGMESKLEDFEVAVSSASSVTSWILEVKAAAMSVGSIMEYVMAGKKAALKVSVNSLETLSKLTDDQYEALEVTLPKISGAGMTVNVDPSALAGAVTGPAYFATESVQETALLAAKNSLAILEAGQSWTTIAKGVLASLGELVAARAQTYNEILNAWYALLAATGEMLGAYRELNVAQAAVETVVAEAERVIDERTLARQQAADTLTKARYNEMFFRLARNNALSRYSAQFDLAQKYAYLAAQAYDYETGLVSSDPDAGEQFIARIVGARTLGEFDDDGAPLPCSDDASGDGGLAAILAEMDANWLVLKPRLGINNPQPYATWFSLRHDLFRIYADEDSDKKWKTELRKYFVEDLNQVSEFRHYCQPLAGSTSQKEPGLVIPFPSLIAQGYNFFGRELAGGDTSLDPTYYATRIAAAGVHFEGYDGSVLAKTPNVFLVPVGEDRMRAVGDRNTILSWKVVDQTIPAPYAIGSTELNNPDWTPLYNGATGGNDLGARIRKHPSFRAYYGGKGEAPSDDSLDCTRLIGRSAWNTRWLLIIPASSMGGADREEALSAFVNGLDADRDGTIESPGVSDIKIGLKTYSTSGN